METTLYTTVRTLNDRFYVNIVDGATGFVNKFGNHGYAHKRSARRAAKNLAAKRSIGYRQDKEHEYMDATKLKVEAPVTV